MSKLSKMCKSSAALLGAGLFALGFTACDSLANISGATQLGKAAAAEALTYTEHYSYDYGDLSEGAEAFAAKFASSVFSSLEDDSQNMAVSPLSVYMALSLAAQCAGGNTQSELLSILGVSYEQLVSQFPYLYRSALFEDTDSLNKQIAVADISNSIWIDDSATAKEECIQTLADNFYCYSYSADFVNDNAKANKAVRKFVKTQTRDLIDQNFNLSTETMFTLINTLYLKDIWNEDGDNLSFTSDEYNFTCSDGSVTSLNLLSGYYNSGRAYKTESYSSFFTKTDHGYTIKFIVPEDGYTLSDVFTEENIAEVNSIADYNPTDEENKLIYKTRCLFPEFTASYNDNIEDILLSYGVNDFFSRGGCDMSALTDDDIYCSQVKHVAKLEVNKKGIEGAAATVIVMDTASEYNDEYQYVYEDFVVDRAFGFILTDRYGTTLFSGVVNAV
ncbi:MAG: hypothetical protein LUD27_07570 [Clostridia bacterium]|nr:hypothetical protein [Clostridia bacterium]